MKTSLLNIAFGFCAFVSFSSFSANPTKIVLAGDPWPPYVSETISGDKSDGIAIDLLRQIFSRVDNVEVFFQLTPWKRGMHYLKQDKVDGNFLLFKTQEREKFIVFTLPYLQDSTAIYYNLKKFPKGITHKSIENFGNYTFAVVSGYSYGPYWDQVFKTKVKSTRQVTSVEQAFKMLDKLRVDLVPATQKVGEAIIAKNNWTDYIKQYPLKTPPVPFYIGFSKNSKSLKYLPQINKAIVDLRQQGVLPDIKDK